ncbi:unnamed protein product [Rangifer tarandus platyrhynchus]|uniref:Uncharacterized protein n=1 Tax=Rangifer tarandus platyrhynchus TaxID=3082113 RepID=A0ABN8YWR3_RANTA|nr:unnamed protein product [Rangifer tarandus platyrhynchus]
MSVGSELTGPGGLPSPLPQGAESSCPQHDRFSPQTLGSGSLRRTEVLSELRPRVADLSPLCCRSVSVSVQTEARRGRPRLMGWMVSAHTAVNTRRSPRRLGAASEQPLRSGG